MITLKIAESDACARTEWHAGIRSVMVLGNFDLKEEAKGETFTDFELLKVLDECDFFDFVGELPLMEFDFDLNEHVSEELSTICFTDPKINLGSFTKHSGGGVVVEVIYEDDVTGYFVVPYDSGYLLGPNGQTMDRID